MRTLVLNAGYEPMQLISWQRSLCLVVAQKAEIVARYDKVVRSVSTSMPLPSVVRLVRYVGAVSYFGRVRCTRKNILLRDQHPGVGKPPGITSWRPVTTAIDVKAR